MRGLLCYCARLAPSPARAQVRSATDPSMQFTKPLPSARLSARRSAQPTPGAVGSSRLPAPQQQAPPASSRSSRPQTTLVSRRSRPRVPLLVADHRASAAGVSKALTAGGENLGAAAEYGVKQIHEGPANQLFSLIAKG